MSHQSSSSNVPPDPFLRVRDQLAGLDALADKLDDQHTAIGDATANIIRDQTFEARHWLAEAAVAYRNARAIAQALRVTAQGVHNRGGGEGEGVSSDAHLPRHPTRGI